MSKKKPVRENAAKNNGLAFLIESELEKAEVVLAAKAILKQLQDMAGDLVKVEANDIMPMMDSMRLTFGPDAADAFNEKATQALRQAANSIKQANDAISAEVARMEGNVNGDLSNDMSMAPEADMGDDLDLDMGAGDDMGGDLELDVDVEDDMDSEGGNAEFDLDAAFDDAAATNSNGAAGRARKESIERNVATLRESKNPDRLVFETFRKTLKESKNATVAARAVAEAFDIDLTDVIDIVKEGKTWKDEKGKTKKNKDYKDERRRKSRERDDDDLEESKLPFDSGVAKSGPSKAKKVEENVFNMMKPRKGIGDYRAKTLDLPTVEDATNKAAKDFRENLRRTMEVPYIFVNQNGSFRVFNSNVNDPFVVKVVNTEDQFLEGIWKGDVLEPRWRVQVVDGKGKLPEGVTKGWVDGPSYRVQKRRK